MTAEIQAGHGDCGASGEGSGGGKDPIGAILVVWRGGRARRCGIRRRWGGEARQNGADRMRKTGWKKPGGADRVRRSLGYGIAYSIS